MKKSLVALAVLAASGIASAQSTVTLYGIVDVGFGSFKSPTPVVGIPTGLGFGGGLVDLGLPNTAIGGSSIRQNRVDSGGISGSRFGFKGSEDLGGGLAANFVLESGFQADTGSMNAENTIFSRQAYVGLSGGFGEVKLGKPWTAYDDISGATNPTFDSNWFSPQAAVFRSNTYNANPGNTVYYATPNLGGFSGAASYSFGENKTATTSAGDITSFHVKYEGGPLFVGFAYQTEEDFAAAGEDRKFARLNASYDFGVAKLLAAYGRVKDDSTTLIGDSIFPKTNEWQVGVDFPVTGALTLSAGYARSKDDVNAALIGADGEVKRTSVGIAALYALSKRTNIYAGVNSSKEKFPTLLGTDLGVDKYRAYAVGVRHTF